ncbi:hypothetical protein FACS1894188_12440 [Clostridia bacterium]|nr:hypothetical protein FACS1894188_12440 [Clostridia bacterium]
MTETEKRTLMMITGNNIRKERKQRNMTLADLAEITDVTAGFMGLVERGCRGMAAGKLIKIAEAFELTINDLVTEKKSGGEVDYSQQKALNTAVSVLNEKEMDYIISIAKALRKMRVGS